ncbi:hypothetical protein MD537_08680 [Flavihumibacter sediminis]|nr:hypothetical protein [Flavihumibacter sediminis]
MPTMKLTQPSLALCLLLDAVGYFTYAMPFLGEFGDLVWAPISGLIYYKLFGGWRGALGGFFSFAEEILPFTDFIPTFTLGYIAQRLGRKKPQSGMVTVAK